MASNETSKYKLSVIEGTELQLSISTGVQGPAGPAGPAGADGPAGPNEITTATATNLTGFIRGDGTNVDGAVIGVSGPVGGGLLADSVAVRNETGNIFATAYEFDDGFDTLLTSGASTGDRTWILPDTSGYVAITTNATGSASNIEIYAKAATTLAKGAVVYISGASGANKLISPAQASTEGLSSKTIGVTIQALATNAFGYVMTEGDLTGLGISLPNGHGVEEGDPIWLSPDTAGGMVFGLANKPSAPDHMVFIGYVTNVNGNTLDSIYVKIQNGFELQELHNVAISSPTTGQVIAYNATTGLWSNQSQAASTITTSTSTNLTGFIIGNGYTISGAMAGSFASTAMTVALRTPLGGLNAQQIRLNQDGNSSYIQINPPAGLTSSATLTLPSSAGTIATNTTAVMLTSDQTVAGNKTFTTNIFVPTFPTTIVTGQVLSYETNDVRYGNWYRVFSTSELQAPSTALVGICSVGLPSQRFYHIEFYASTYAGAGQPANSTIRLLSSVTTDNRISGLATFGGSTMSYDDVEIDGFSTIVEQSVGVGDNFRLSFSGIIEVNNNTVLSLQFRQSTTSANSVFCRKGAYIIARSLG